MFKGKFCITNGTLYLEMDEKHHDSENHPDYLTVPLQTWKGSNPLAVLVFTNLHTFRSVTNTDKQKRTYLLTNVFPVNRHQVIGLEQTEEFSGLQVLKNPLLLSVHSSSEDQQEVSR